MSEAITLRDAQIRHARYYADLLWTQIKLYQSGDAATQTTAVAALEQERRQLEQGQLCAASLTNRDIRAAKICIDYASPGFLPYFRISMQQRTAWLEAALEGVIAWGFDPHVKASHLSRLGSLYYATGQIELAVRHYSKALELATAGEDADMRFKVTRSMAFLYQMEGQYSEAEELLRSALQATDCVEGHRANCLGALGSFYYQQRRYDQAEQYYQQALALSTELRAVSDQIGYLCDLGNIWDACQQYDLAHSCYMQALGMASEANEMLQTAIVHTYLGSFYSGREQHEKATEHYREAAVIQREIGDRPGLLITLWSLAGVLRTLMHYDRALECYEEALTLTRETGDILFEGDVLDSMGFYWFTLDERAKSLAYYQMAKSVYQSAGAHNLAQEVGERIAEVQHLM